MGNTRSSPRTTAKCLGTEDDDEASDFVLSLWADKNFQCSHMLNCTREDEFLSTEPGEVTIQQQENIPRKSLECGQMSFTGKSLSLHYSKFEGFVPPLIMKNNLLSSSASFDDIIEEKEQSVSSLQAFLGSEKDGYCLTSNTTNCSVDTKDDSRTPMESGRARGDGREELPPLVVDDSYQEDDPEESNEVRRRAENLHQVFTRLILQRSVGSN